MKNYQFILIASLTLLIAVSSKAKPVPKLSAISEVTDDSSSSEISDDLAAVIGPQTDDVEDTAADKFNTANGVRAPVGTLDSNALVKLDVFDDADVLDEEFEYSAEEE